MQLQITFQSRVLSSLVIGTPIFLGCMAFKLYPLAIEYLDKIPLLFFVSDFIIVSKYIYKRSLNF